MKIVYYIITILFVLFGLVQFNDPDAFLWILTYFSVAGIALGLAHQRYSDLIVKVLLIFLSMYFIGLLPELIATISNYDANLPQDPTITHTANAQTEIMKEVGGVGVCLFFLVIVFYKKRKEKRAW